MQKCLVPVNNLVFVVVVDLLRMKLVEMMFENVWRTKLVLLDSGGHEADKANSDYLEEMFRAIGLEVILKSVKV